MARHALLSKFAKLSTFLTTTTVAGMAFAQDSLGELERVGKPVPSGTSLQPAVTGVAEGAHRLNGGLNVLIIAISIFVCLLLIYVIFAFRDRGREPRRFSHNTPLEIAWTLIPVVILVVLAAYSLPQLKNQTIVPEGEVVVKVTGYQWYWSYEYPDEGIAFDSYMLEKEQLAEYGYTDDEYLLAVDNAMVVPVGVDVRVIVTAADVIHSWKVPSFAVQTDAVPGRAAETWFNAKKEGLYFGQCSELCGKLHAYMPIAVKVVSQEAYAEWLEAAKEEFAALPEALVPAETALVEVASLN